MLKATWNFLQCLVYVDLYDHQLIRCTRKMVTIERDGNKEIKSRSLRNYPDDCYEKALGEVNFPNYEDFDNVNDAHSKFIQKLMAIIDKVAPAKNEKMKTILKNVLIVRFQKSL